MQWQRLHGSGVMVKKIIIGLSLLLAACGQGDAGHGLHGSTGGGGGGPTLTSPLAIADGTDHAQVQIQTNTASGTLYYVVTKSCGSPPNVAQIQAGHDGTGSTPSPGAAGNQTVSATGKQNANPAGTIAAVGTYCAYFQHHTTGGDSTVSASATFLTPGTISFNITTTTAFNTQQGGTFPAVLADFENWFTGCFCASTNITMVMLFDSDAAQCGGGCAGKTLGDTGVAALYDTQLRPAYQSLPNQSTFVQAAFAALPATDPTGLGNTYRALCNDMHVLGLSLGTACNALAGIGATYFNPGQTYEVTANGSVAGLSLWGTILHEFTENAGRGGGQELCCGALPLDLWTYQTPAPNSTRQTLMASGRFMSVDGGSTNFLAPDVFSTTDTGTGADLNSGGLNIYFESGAPGVAATPVPIAILKYMMPLGYTLTHNCRVTYGFTNLNWLLKRDLDPAANDNSPAFIYRAA